MGDAGPSINLRSGPPGREDQPRLSALLAAAAADPRRERVTVGDLLDLFGHRAFGALIFVFAAPNAIPIPMPGVSAILGAPLLLLAWQLMLGRPQPWLPDRIRRRSFRRTEFARLVRRLLPWLERLERLIRPRLLWMTSQPGERVIGMGGCVLALVIFLPLPFGNMLPGLGLALAALGVLARDGVAVLAGALAGTAGLALVAGAFYGLTVSVLFLLHNALGL